METVAKARILPWVIAVAALVLGGCATEPSAPAPLPDGPAPALSLAAVAATQSIDLSQPLSGDSLAAIAVFTNPDLIALRTGEGVAEAQVFAAGLFPDPVFNFALDAPLNGNDVSSGLFLGLGIDFAALARRPAAMRGAQANLDAVRFDIAWSEWLTGEQATLLATRVVHLRQIKALTDQLRQLADGELARNLRATSRGDIPAASLEASRLAAADAADRNRSTELLLRTAELDLNRLLGIAPATQLELAPPPGPISTLPSEQALYQCAIATRADLAGLRAAYEGSQAGVDMAILARYPLPTLNINATRDTSRLKTIGPAITFTLPLWNRGRGDVAVARASQAQLRENYIARLTAIHADVATALANLQITQLQRDEVVHELVPLQPQVEANDRAAARGDLPVAAANAARMTLLDKQLVEAALALSLAELEIALEVSVGRPLESIQ
ncbi:MAG: TolC family protein [Halioglobus sp.]|nr:TolC family protein [Halioglobus sp.]